MSESKPIRIVKRDKDREQYLERHERSLLYLLIEKDVQRAKVIIEKILLTKQTARV